MSPTVLIVEDDGDLRRLYAVGLSHRGYRIRLAANGADALDRLETEDADVVLLDIIMPVMDGWEVIEKINPPDREDPIPVVVLSGTAKPRDKEMPPSLKLWIEKPTSLEELDDAIRAAVEG